MFSKMILILCTGYYESRLVREKPLFPQSALPLAFLNRRDEKECFVLY